jgi:signal transduction histidine kinase
MFLSERASRTAAEHANNSKDEFLATLSHELRSPLNAILAWTNVIRGGERGLFDQACEIIDRNVSTQIRLIEDLLDMSRIASGKLHIDVRPIDPISFIESALEIVMPAAAGKQIRIERAFDPNAGNVLADDVRMLQVISNLLTNAIKFAPIGGRVEIRLERVDAHIEITVADTGVGIEADFLPYVFERFRQANSTISRRHGGLGLGLSLVKQLVELHGGTVRAESAGLNLGSTFVVCLPIQRNFE